MLDGPYLLLKSIKKQQNTTNFEVTQHVLLKGSQIDKPRDTVNYWVWSKPRTLRPYQFNSSTALHSSNPEDCLFLNYE